MGINYCCQRCKLKAGSTITKGGASTELMTQLTQWPVRSAARGRVSLLNTWVQGYRTSGTLTGSNKIVKL